MTEQEARRQTRRERAFYTGLASYLLVNTMLVVVNVLTSESFWAIWPILGWGVGIAAQAVGVFGLPGRGRGWEERRVRALMGADGNAERLRSLVDEAVERRAPRRRGARGDGDEAARLRERVEHLEAIVTSHDWDLVEPAARAAAAAPAPPLALPDADETPEEKVARLARRVR